MPNGIVSTWDLDTFEGYGGWVKDDFMFINLGSGELRGLVCRADHSLGHCINLESVHLRGQKFLGDVECLDCINLRSGHLRGLQVDAQVRSRNCINLGPGRPRTLEVREQLVVVIVSAWNLFAVENQPCIRRKTECNCINLGFGHLRGLAHASGGDHRDCIYLGSGHLRRHSSLDFIVTIYCINLGFGHLR